VASRHPTVAVVDDDKSVGRALARLLAASSFEARTFGSGQTFLDSLAAEVPDFVVLDLHMPGMNGLDVIAALADAGLALPVIMITGNASPETEIRCQAAGVVAYLSKPLDQATFLQAAAEAAAGSRGSSAGTDDPCWT
jgi:FixJ family two-component response regulator